MTQQQEEYDIQQESAEALEMLGEGYARGWDKPIEIVDDGDLHKPPPRVSTLNLCKSTSRRLVNWKSRTMTTMSTPFEENTMAKTHIEWSEDVWNPLTGCTKIGQGCKHCYAEVMAKRLKAMGRAEYQDAVDDKGHWTGKITLVEDRLSNPLHWKKPRRVFVNSMSDLFHKDVPQEFIRHAFRTMRKADWHQFQVLTKRYDLAAKALETIQPASHIKIGFSVCNQDDADKARKSLFEISLYGWETWVSYEPALEEVDWTGFGFIDWMVCGGESGPGCRPFSVTWARNALRYCRAADSLQYCRSANVPFFMKQLGGHPNKRDQITDFPEDLQIREFPA